MDVFALSVENMEAFVLSHPAAWLKSPHGYRIPFGDGYNITVEPGLKGVVQVGVLKTANSLFPFHDTMPNPDNTPIIDRVGGAAARILKEQGKPIDLPDWLVEPTALAFEAEAQKLIDQAAKVRAR